MQATACSNPKTRLATLVAQQDPSTLLHTKNRRLRACQARHYRKLVPYEQGWIWQKELLGASCNTELDQDTVLLLQHPPVYTLGAGSTTDYLKFDEANPPHPLFRTERGGEVTYHGPGQLVMYPILNLKHHTADLHWYLRSLEEVVIRALENVSGLQGERVAGSTGVWVQGLKVAAVGVRAKRWITYHGVALNVTTDLAPFQHIVPCGIADRAVSSVKQLCDHNIADWELLQEYEFALLDAFADVFDLSVEVKSM